MRSNLSVGIEAMSCQYNWSSGVQGTLLSAFFWGYALFQIPGGFLTNKFGGKLIFGVGVLMTSILTCLVPLVITGSFNPIKEDLQKITCVCNNDIAKGWGFKHGHYKQYDEHGEIGICDENSWFYGLLFLRILMGMCEAVTYPAVYGILSLWVPAAERSLLSMLSCSGAYMGVLIAFPSSSLLVTYNYWPNVFYLFGFLGCVWSLFWFVLATTPSSDKYITPAEYEYIQHGKDHSESEQLVPWRIIFCDLSCWACYAAHFGYNWVGYTSLTYLPTYLNKALGYNMYESGFLSMFAYVLMFVSAWICGIAADKLINHGILSVVATRRLFVIIGFGLSAGTMLPCAFFEDKTLCMILMCTSSGIIGVSMAGWMTNYLDISGKHAASCYAVGNTIATIPGILSPIITGHALGKDPGLHEWATIFILGFVVLTVTGIFFVCTVNDQHYKKKKLYSELHASWWED